MNNSDERDYAEEQYNEDLLRDITELSPEEQQEVRLSRMVQEV